MTNLRAGLLENLSRTPTSLDRLNFSVVLLSISHSCDFYWYKYANNERGRENNFGCSEVDLSVGKSRAHSKTVFCTLKLARYVSRFSELLW